MNVVKALRAAAKPSFWPALSRAVVPTIEHAPAFAAVEPSCIIDVGANKGQFSSFAAGRWPDVPIIAFEPLPGPAARYRTVLRGRATLHTCALGAAEGQSEIHIASREDSSSLLALGERQKSIFGMAQVSTMPVQVRRLENVLGEEDLGGRALLKIDVQGYEHEVLQGLGVLARSIAWVFVEVSFVELYMGQHMYGDVDDLLQELGFELVLEHNPTVHAGKKIQADLLYGKPSN